MASTFNLKQKKDDEQTQNRSVQPVQSASFAVPNWSSALSGLSGGVGSIGGIGGSVGSSGSAPSVSGSYQYAEYAPSQAVLDAQQKLNGLQAPSAYQSNWQDQLQNTLNDILNRPKFQYDVNGDALYQQYKERYQALGQQAMMDTMGQAAAMTGGYGNSYASTAGNQAYQSYLQGLNDKVPELYALARQSYDADTQSMYDRANLINAMENQEYGRWNDQYNRYADERAYLANMYQNERDYDYSRFSDQRNFARQTDRDRVSDEQWAAEFAENQRQFDAQMAMQEAARAAAASAAASSGRSSGYSSGGYSSGGGSGNGYGYETTASTPQYDEGIQTDRGTVYVSGATTNNGTVPLNNAMNQVRNLVTSMGADGDMVFSYLTDMVANGQLSEEDAAQVLNWYRVQYGNNTSSGTTSKSSTSTSTSKAKTVEKPATTKKKGTTK